MDLSFQEIRYAYQDPTNMYMLQGDSPKHPSGSKPLDAPIGQSEKSLTRLAKLPPYSSSVHAIQPAMSHPPMRVKEVPDLNNVQPFFSDPIATDNVGYVEHRVVQPKGSLTQSNGATSSLYGDQASMPETIVNEKVKKALATSWTFDPRACSTGPAQQYVSVPHHGLTDDEYTWVKGNKFSLVADAIKERQNEVDLAKQSLDLDKQWVTYEPYPSFDDIDLDQELDAFYGTGEAVNCTTTDNMTINREQLATDRENAGRDSMSTTWVTLPQSNRMSAGPSTSCAFRDSAIHMEDYFAQAANKESPPQSACMTSTEQAFSSYDESNGNYFGASVEDSLALFEASKQAASSSELDVPYNFSGFVSSENGLLEREDPRSMSGDVEMNEDAGSAMLNIHGGEAATCQQDIAIPQRINSLFDGYLHNTTHTLNLEIPPSENSLANGFHGTVPEIPETISQEEFPQIHHDTPEFVIYNQNAPSSLDLPTESSMQFLGDLQAHAGASSFDNPTNVVHLGGDYRAINFTRTTIARRGEYQNLTPEYDSDSDNNLDHLEPASPITLADSNQNVNNHLVAGDLNPYDYRHYLPSNVPQSSPGMDLNFLALSSPNNIFSASNTNQVNPTTIEGPDPNSMFVQPSLHPIAPAISRVSCSPTTIPPSSPPVLNLYGNGLITSSPVYNSLNSPMHFVTSTPTPVMMGNTDPVSPSPAPRNENKATNSAVCPGEGNTHAVASETARTRMRIWPEEDDAVAEATESCSKEAETPAQDYFGAQQKRKVGRPIGSKSAKKNTNGAAEKDAVAKPDAKSVKKKVTKKAGDAGSELKRVRTASAEAARKKGNDKIAKKAGVETVSATTTANDKPTKEKALKHKQPATTEETEPMKKRVRRPSRKSAGNVPAAK